MNLYELATQYQADASKLAELDLDDETLAATLEGLGADLEEKARNTAAVVRNLEALATAIKQAEADMAKRRKAIENRAERVREWILRSMQAGNIKKIESPLFRISVRQTPGKVIVDNAASIPAQYWRMPDPPPPEVNKKAIQDAVRSGKEVPGVHIEKSEELRIE